MKVQDIMTTDIGACAPGDSLTKAVETMRDHDCGVVPVLDSHGHVLGVLTDRDICMACYAQDAPPSALRVDTTMSIAVRTCSPDDSTTTVEKAMQAARIRRLPVVDANKRLVGMISLNDIARESERERRSEVRQQIQPAEVVEALASICEPRAVRWRPSMH